MIAGCRVEAASLTILYVRIPVRRFTFKIILSSHDAQHVVIFNEWYFFRFWFIVSSLLMGETFSLRFRCSRYRTRAYIHTQTRSGISIWGTPKSSFTQIDHNMSIYTSHSVALFTHKTHRANILQRNVYVAPRAVRLLKELYKEMCVQFL